MTVTEVDIDVVKVGDRYRKEIGDLSALCESIERQGLLHPILIDDEGTLIVGERRLRAFQELGLKRIPARVVDIPDHLQAEHDENVCRKEFTWSELVGIGRAIEEREAKAAKTRMLSGKPVDPMIPGSQGTTRAAVGSHLGISGATYERAKAVVEAAERDPERFAPVLQKLDAGEITPKRAAVEVSSAIKREASIERASLPDAKYRVIYADPPWSYGSGPDDPGARPPEFGGTAKVHYPTMSIGDIAAMEIREIAEDDSVLFLWATSPLLPEAIAVMAAWGFKYKSSFVWDKVAHNFGYYNSVRHELLLIGTRGSCLPEDKTLRDSVVSIERGEHSAKPSEFREIIDAMYPNGKRLELFARTASEGWETYGNQL